MIIDDLAIDWKDPECYQTLCKCSLVCKTWSQRASKYLYSTVSIHSVQQLLQYDKVKDASHSLVHTLHISIATEDAEKDQRRCSLVGSTLLLISKLPNLQHLDIYCDWHNNYHPQMFKFLSNTSVKTLHCDFEMHGIIKPIFQFITYFRSLQHLSLRLHLPSPLKSHNRPFQRAFPKTKICLKELYLNIGDDEMLKLVTNAFMGAQSFASHICKHSCNIGLTVGMNEDDVNDYQSLLLHCSSSLQVFNIEETVNINNSFPPGKS